MLFLFFATQSVRILIPASDCVAKKYKFYRIRIIHYDRIISAHVQGSDGHWPGFYTCFITALRPKFRYEDSRAPELRLARYAVFDYNIFV